MATYNFDKLRATAISLITKFGFEITVTNNTETYDDYGNPTDTDPEVFNNVKAVYIDTHILLIQAVDSMIIDTHSTITVDSVDYKIKVKDRTAPDDNTIIWVVELHDLEERVIK